MVDNDQIIQDAKTALDAAIKAQNEAKRDLDNIVASQRDVQRAFDEAKKALEAAKPTLTVAKAQLAKTNADVTIARAELAKVAPALNGKAGTEHSKVRQAVTEMLRIAPQGMTGDEIFAGLLSQGIEMAGAKPRENLNAYLSRWDGIVNLGRGRWGVPQADDVTEEVPAFLQPEADAADPVEPEAVTEEVPAFLQPDADTAELVEGDADTAEPEAVEAAPVKKSKKNKQA